MGLCIVTHSRPYWHSTIDQRFVWTDGQFSRNVIHLGPVKIQWGCGQFVSGSYYTITFLEPYSSTGYVAIASYTTSDNPEVLRRAAALTNQKTTSVDIYTAGGQYTWFTMGI